MNEAWACHELRQDQPEDHYLLEDQYNGSSSNSPFNILRMATSSSSSSSPTVRIEPDASKLDPTFQKECPLLFEPSDFSEIMAKETEEIANTECRLLFQKLVNGENVFLTVTEKQDLDAPSLLCQMSHRRKQ